MKSALHVGSPPLKPLMIYDGDCAFCRLWIRRWQHTTGDRVEFLPYQDPQIASRYPEIPREQLERAVQLIQPDGAVYTAAEAVFHAFALSPHGAWLLDLYHHWPAFASSTEWIYSIVAQHRRWFSLLTRLLWGHHVELPDHRLLRWVFLRGLGLIYLIAFVSLWVQIAGLGGSNGILPVRLTMQAARQQVSVAGVGLDRYHLLPTLCWFSSSDSLLQWQCLAGTVLAVVLIAGLAPALCLFLLWLIYLSLATSNPLFLGFQWDALLLETGFLAIFFAPLQLLPRRLSREAPPSRLVLWLLRWVLFRLVFECGCAKLSRSDPTWHNLTALPFHYETQPLPTWIGWYAHQLPPWIHQSSAAVMFGIELGVPFLIFAPRRPRQFACLAFVILQLAILLTGNYAFFNLLTLLLCLVLLDDAALQKCLPNRLSSALFGRDAAPQQDRVATCGRFDAPSERCPPHASPGPPHPTRRFRWPALVTVPLAVVVFCSCWLQIPPLFRITLPCPAPVRTVYGWFVPFRSINTYGLFSIMPTSRPEIIIEGSNDRLNWSAYEFKYKPGNVMAHPEFVAPHQPRLDWHMYFAASSTYHVHPWLVNVCLRLLQGSPEVLALLKDNPFPQSSPRYIRAILYEYHFTDLATRRKTGAWWRRELKGIYLSPLSLSDPAEAPSGAAREIQVKKPLRLGM